jgi:hypothetical protein
MKHIKIPLIYIICIVICVILSGCYGSTIDALSSFTFQFPVNFHANYYHKAAPDTSKDYANLNKYKEYNDYKDKINKAQVLHLNYWIDSLKYVDEKTGDTITFDPITNTNDLLGFEFIKFSIVFAKYLPDLLHPNYNDTVSTNWIPDYSLTYSLGNFKDVKVKEYYRNPSHIEYVSENTALIISDLLKKQPSFFVISEYSKVNGQDSNKYYFPLINARFDIDIRFDVDL